MRALIYADVQATDGHERMFSQPEMPLQIHRVRKFYADLWAIFQDRKCDCLWDLGDTTDDRSNIPIPAIDAVMEGLEPFAQHEMNLKLVGNHEQYSRNCDIHVGRMFASKFQVIAQTDVFEALNTLVACVAYPASDAAALDWINKTAYKFRNYQRRLLLGHFQVVGASMATGKAILGIPQATLDKFSLSLLGHIHKPQQIAKRGFYIGSPFQQNFGEKEEAKRVAILDLESLTLESVPLNGYPEYRVVNFEDWVKAVRDTEEHRYKVLIREPKQAEQFYAHPLMSRAEPVYNYELNGQTKEEMNRQTTFSRSSVMERWLAKHKPENYGINATAEDMLDAGNLLADGETA